jgi:glutamyl/glutaminyl-tRNA synthetase
VASSDPIPAHPIAVNPYTADDILAILREHNWLVIDPTAEQFAWCERAAALLGHHVSNKAALAELLQLVFTYEAVKILKSSDAHAVLARRSARDVIRYIALLLLDPTPFTSERFKEIVTQLKENVDVRSRDLFHPIRLAIAGRVGEGELDRVILLLNDAAALPFAVRVKSVRERILEFCAALD